MGRFVREFAMYPPDDLLRSVARAAETVDSTAPPVDEVDAAVALDALARRIVEHNRRLFAGEPVDWEALICQVDDAERACRRLLGGSSPQPCATRTRRPAEQLSTSPIYG